MAYYKWYSHRLGYDMQLKVYGSGHGKPVLVFPSSKGTFFQYEDFGMVATVQGFIDANKITLYCVPSVDAETFFNKDWWDNGGKARRQNEYEAAILYEVVPFIRDHHHNDWRLMVTGCSWGAYHSVNYALKHPDIIDTCVALSGVYDLSFVLGDYVDQDVYFHIPTLYAQGITDEGYLHALKQSRIHIVVGTGEYDRELPLSTARELNYHLHQKGIQSWLDEWGPEVNHDWGWWKQMIVKHLDALNF